MVYDTYDQLYKTELEQTGLTEDEAKKVTSIFEGMYMCIYTPAELLNYTTKVKNERTTNL